MRIGYGCDTHALAEGRPLVLGGVKIPFEKGLCGHSDADVLLHAIIDALLGACALPDIGRQFPDTDPAYEGVDSMVLLAKTKDLMEKAGRGPIANIDAVIIAQRPKLAPYINAMRERIAQTLGMELSQVNIKAKTNEGMDAIGRGEGMEARAVVLIES